ncbi:MAG: hypothetical protein IKF50_08655 [Clostridia bacterium]|nr:hypothetical protein [Clostridia bacterium]
MEQSKKASQYYLPMGFWVCLVVFGIASFWRLFVALNKQLSILGYLDFFIVTACLVVGSLLQNKWRRYLIAAGLVALAVFTQIVNKGFGFNLGGIFLSGSALLSLRYASDLLYYVLMLVIAVLILCNKNKTAGILALVAAVFSLIYTGISIAATTIYTGDFQIAWEWWLANSMLVPMYFVCTFMLAVTLFALQYHAIDRHLKDRDIARKTSGNANKQNRKISA